MLVLFASQAELAKALPSAGASSSSAAGSPAVKELRKLLEQVDTIKAERDALEQDLKVSQDDLGKKNPLCVKDKRCTVKRECTLLHEIFAIR